MSRLDVLEAFFKAWPGLWIDGMEIARLAGAYAWRTRVSELRTQRGMTIENRQRRIGKRCVSEYRWAQSEVSHV